MNAPYSHDLSNARAAVLGMPFDCGTHLFRIGSRQGPAAIREQSRLVRPYNPERSDYSPVDRLGLVDCGDVRVVPGRVLDAFENIEAATRAVVESGSIPVTMGGDGSVSLPQMRAVSAKFGPLAELHDALRERPVYLCFDMDAFDLPAHLVSARRAGGGCRPARASTWSVDSPDSISWRSTSIP